MDSRARNFSYKVPKESLALKARGIACIPLLGILFLLGSGNHALADQANYSLLIKGGGSLHAMGFNVNGQLGTRNTTSKNSPTQIVASGVETLSEILPADGGYGGGVWLWHAERGWLWTKQGLYPFLYQDFTQDWIYYLGSKAGRAYYFNYSAKQVE